MSDGDDDADDAVGDVDPRRAARVSLVAGAVVVAGGALGVVALGADPIALTLLAVGATLLGGGGGVLMSLPPAPDEGKPEREEPPEGEVVSALAGGEEFERDRAGDGDGAQPGEAGGHDRSAVDADGTIEVDANRHRDPAAEDAGTDEESNADRTDVDD